MSFQQYSVTVTHMTEFFVKPYKQVMKGIHTTFSRLHTFEHLKNIINCVIFILFNAI